MSRLIDADALQLAIVEEGQANKRKKYIIGDIWELTGAEIREVINSQPTIQSEPHWIPVTEDTPDEERECWITPKTTNKIYRGIFTRHYGECHRTGFICDDGFMWLNTALAWMYCEVPEPYKGVTT